MKAQTASAATRRPSAFKDYIYGDGYSSGIANCPAAGKKYTSMVDDEGISDDVVHLTCPYSVSTFASEPHDDLPPDIIENMKSNDRVIPLQHRTRVAMMIVNLKSKR